MKKNEQLVPKRRFKEFENDGEWKKCKLGEMVTIKSGSSPASFHKGEELYIKVDDLNYSMREQSNSQMKVALNDEAKQVSPGSIIFPKRGAAIMTNKVRILNKKGYMDTNMMALEPYNINKNFLYTFISKTGLYKIADTSTIPQINNKHIEPYNLLAPADTEQEKIGLFFKKVDQIIQKQHTKINKIKVIKKSYLSDLFPKEGEKYPTRRFNGFTKKWSHQKLNVLTDVRDGTHDSPKYYSEGHPFITSKNVSNGFIDYEGVQYISDTDFNQINKRSKVEKNDILMGMIGTIGNIALVRENPDYAIKNVALIKDIGNIYYLYLYHVLQSSNILKQLDEAMDGGTQKFIALNKIRDLIIPVPSKKEQIKIASFFKNLDAQIDLEQQKLNKLEQLKQAYLNELFV